MLVTRWSEFQRVPDLLPRGVKAPILIDGRRMLDPAAVDRYEGIGR
jgi:UDPglucose 6-dehydrogenase